MKQWNKLIMITGLLLSLPLLSIGQDTLTTKDTRFIYTLFGNWETKNGEGLLIIDRIEITDLKSKQLIQTINPESKFENPKNDEIFKPVDINYDGMNDFIILTSNAQYKDASYDFYLYDVKANTFKKWVVEFNDGNNSINVRPSFEPKTKTITTYWHNTETLQKVSTFKFTNGAYHLIEEFNQDLDKDSDYKYVLSTLKKVINGKLTVVEKELIPIKPIDD